MPRDGIGRVCKIGKEEIAGLVTTLRLALEEDASGALRAGWSRRIHVLAKDLAGLNHATLTLRDDPKRDPAPMLAITIDEKALGRSAEDISGCPGTRQSCDLHGVRQTQPRDAGRPAAMPGRG